MEELSTLLVRVNPSLGQHDLALVASSPQLVHALSTLAHAYSTSTSKHREILLAEQKVHLSFPFPFPPLPSGGD